MFFSNENLISIDIGTSCVKVIEFSGGSNKKKLKRCGYEMLNPGVVRNGVIEDANTLTATLKSLFKKLKINTKFRRCALSVGGSSIVIRRTLLESKIEKDEVLDQIRYEIEQHFQYDPDELEFSHHEYHEHEHDGMTPYIICGAKKEIIRSYVEVVKNIGLKIGVIDSDILCVANMFTFNYGSVPGLSVIIKVGASSTSIIFMESSEFLFAREIQTGGEFYTSNISEKLNLDIQQAENIKKTSINSDGQIPHELVKCINEVNLMLLDEINSCIDYFIDHANSSNSHDHINQIFLIGGGSKILGLDAALASKYKVSVNLLNPFYRIDVNPKKFDLSQEQLYGVAVGLGIRKMSEL